MTYDEARSYLGRLADYERALPRSYDKATFGLERARRLCEELGRPQDAYRVIQVGGTNGKGSVCAFAESILREAGVRTGLTTSPHLIDLRERIVVGGRMVSETLFAECVADAARAVDRLPEDERETVTFFEVLIAVAFEAFRRSEVEVAVVEVGLGGRFDATSLTHPSVLVVTPIGLDHQVFLGDTVEQIARDKSHLVRGPAPVVLGCSEETREPFRERAREFGAPVHELGKDFEPVADLALGLPGAFQAANAACARMAVSLARPEVSADAVERGLARTRWPGRFQTIEGDPPIILDGAMNPEAAAALGAELTRAFDGRPVALVLGMSQDKTPVAFVEALLAACPAVSSVIACSAENARAMDAAELAERLETAVRLPVRSVPAVKDALTAARQSGCGVVCVTGSLYVIGDAFRALGIEPFAS